MNGLVTGTVGTTNRVGDQPTWPVAVVLLYRNCPYAVTLSVTSKSNLPKNDLRSIGLTMNSWYVTGWRTLSPVVLKYSVVGPW